MSKPKSPPKLITVRNYKGVDPETAKHDLECVPWDIVSLFEDVDYSLFNAGTIFFAPINKAHEFDSVSHQIVLKKLSACGVSGGLPFLP